MTETCSVCGKGYEVTVTPTEAALGMMIDFPGHDPATGVPLCHNCYQLALKLRDLEEK